MSIICKPFVVVRHGETPLNRERVGNVAPMWILPGTRAGEWTITPLEEKYAT